MHIERWRSASIFTLIIHDRLDKEDEHSDIYDDWRHLEDDEG